MQVYRPADMLPCDKMAKIHALMNELDFRGVLLPDVSIGGHGWSEVEVTRVRGNRATIDISPWVDEDGIGTSTSGQTVEKKFPKRAWLVWGEH